jgi:hypothetical protein
VRQRRTRVVGGDERAALVHRRRRAVGGRVRGERDAGAREQAEAGERERREPEREQNGDGPAGSPQAPPAPAARVGEDAEILCGGRAAGAAQVDDRGLLFHGSGTPRSAKTPRDAEGWPRAGGPGGGSGRRRPLPERR